MRDVFFHPLCAGSELFVFAGWSATRTRASHDATIRNGLSSHRLLHEPLEELPWLLAAARVEAERELVQVVSQLGLADGARVRPHQPALQPPGHKIHARHPGKGSAVEPLLEGMFPAGTIFVDIRSEKRRVHKE